MLKKNYCSCCGRKDVEHIGKSSAGWIFSFQGTETIRNLKDWYKNITGANVYKIVDEYGVEYAPKQLLELIYEKRGCGKINNNYVNFPNEKKRVRMLSGYEEGRKSLYSGERWQDENGNSFSGYDFS